MIAGVLSSDEKVTLVSTSVGVEGKVHVARGPTGSPSAEAQMIAPPNLSATSISRRLCLLICSCLHLAVVDSWRCPVLKAASACSAAPKGLVDFATNVPA